MWTPKYLIDSSHLIYLPSKVDTVLQWCLKRAPIRTHADFLALIAMSRRRSSSSCAVLNAVIRGSRRLTVPITRRLTVCELSASVFALMVRGGWLIITSVSTSLPHSSWSKRWCITAWSRNTLGGRWRHTKRHVTTGLAHRMSVRCSWI